MDFPVLRLIAFPVALAAGALVPGWMLGRALRTPFGWPSAFLGSGAILVNLLIAFDAIGVTLTFAHLAIGLAVVSAALAAIGRGRRPQNHAAVPAPAAAKFEFNWLLLPAALGFVAILWRIAFDPLSGSDTLFRWDFLAREMFRAHSLHFYPAISAADFLHYGWCDGIAPLVSGFYFWSYLSLGRVAAWATSPLVILQTVLLFALVRLLAARRSGPVGAATACALLATSSVTLWGVAIGQETGLTAICLLAMFRFLERHEDEPEQAWLIWAGIAAGVGGLAREYGLIFPFLGAIALAWRRTLGRDAARFFLPALIVAAPWYLRNWIKTGNPLWWQPLGGLFPSNAAQLDYFRAVAELRGPGSPEASLAMFAVGSLALVGVTFALAFASLLIARRRADAPLVIAAIVMILLWLWSVKQTSGGYVYSLRMLTPALAIAAVVGATALGRLAERRNGGWVAVTLGLLAIDGGVRSLHLPAHPDAAWWRSATAPWTDFRDGVRLWRASRNWKAIAEAADGKEIVVADPTFHAVLADLGAKPVPLFSPKANFLFDESSTLSAACDRLRAGNVRFILLAAGNDVLTLQLSRHAFFRELTKTPPAGEGKFFVVYDLYSAALGLTPPASR